MIKKMETLTFNGTQYEVVDKYARKQIVNFKNKRNGKSAYQIAVDNGFEGTEKEWLLTIKGEKGDKGDKGDKGEQGERGLQGEQGNKGAKGDKGLKGDKGDQGVQGKSAYDIAVENGFKGSESDWIDSLKGDKGDQGQKGDQGLVGKSAYELAVAMGYKGDLNSWLNSLKGEKGDKGDRGLKGDKGERGDIGDRGKQGIQGEKGASGKSAYQIAVDNGFSGTEAEWLATLKGSAGASAYEIAVENGYEGTEEEWAQGLENIQNLSLRTGAGTNSISMNNPNTVSTGAYSIAEGNGTKATAASAHAEGTATQATGVQAHSEGDRSQATRNAAHAEGYITKATGNYSHSQNQGTIAKGVGQTAIGAYNVEQGSVASKVDTDYAFIIGNGTDENNRSNALAVKWDGTLVFSDGSEIQSNYYVTPEMFGAVGDGVTNDLAAFQAALLQSRPIYLENKHYLIDGDLYITQPNTVIQGKCGAYSSTSPRLVFTNQHGIHIEQATYKMLFKGFAIFSDGTGLTMQGDGRIANLTFEDLYFKCRRDVFLDAETGYIYFKKCHFDFDPNTTFDGDLVKITYTGTSENRANYISFNQCEFEGQNIPNHGTDYTIYLIHLDNCSNISIANSDVCNCYNAIKFGTTGASQFINITNNYFWNIKTIANIASCMCFNMTGNSQYTPSGVQPIVFPSNKRGHVITGNIFNIGAWVAVSVENLYTVFDNNQIMGTISNEVLTKLHIGEYKGYVAPTTNR